MRVSTLLLMMQAVRAAHVLTGAGWARLEARATRGVKARGSELRAPPRSVKAVSRASDRGMTMINRSVRVPHTSVCIVVMQWSTPLSRMLSPGAVDLYLSNVGGRCAAYLKVKRPLSWYAWSATFDCSHFTYGWHDNRHERLTNLQTWERLTCACSKQ